jgi:hypothetical protein
MGSLDNPRRAIFVAALLEGLSPVETAGATGLDVPTIDHRVRSLRRSFQLWVAAQRGESVPSSSRPSRPELRLRRVRERRAHCGGREKFASARTAELDVRDF